MMRIDMRSLRTRSAVVSLLAITLIGMAASTSCLAQELEFVDTLPAADKGLDLAIPDSPGFAVIGLEAENVTRPTTPRELAAALLNGVDAHGNFQSGLALDTTPYMLLAGDQLTIGEYRRNPVARTLARTQVSLATAKGVSDDDESVRVGLGVRTVLWDEGDPRLDDELWECFRSVYATRPRLTDDKYKQLELLEPKLIDEEIEQRMADWRANPSTPAHPTPAQEQAARTAFQKPARTAARKRIAAMLETEFAKDDEAFRDSVEPEMEKCRAAQKERQWNASGFELAAAPSLIQKPDDSDAVDFNGAVFWASLAYGFENVPALEDSSQLIAHLRYRLDEDAPIQDADGEFEKQDSFLAGLRLRIGGSGAIAAGRPRFSNLNLSLEGDYVRTDPHHGDVDDSYRFTVATDLQIVKDIWLNLGIGGTGGRKDDDRLFVLASLKWGSKTFNLTEIVSALDSVPGS